MTVRTSFSGRTVARYALAGLLTSVAVLVWQVLVSYVGLLPHYITLYPAVMLTAILAGMGPGLLATGLGAIMAAHWIIPPEGVIFPMDLNDAVGLCMFTVMGVFMTVVAELYHRNRQRVSAYEKELAVREEQVRNAAEIERQRQLLAVTLASIGDGVIVTDIQGFVTFVNGEAEKLTGWSNVEAAGRPLTEVFKIVNAYTHEKVENPVDKVLRLGTVVELANHTVLLAKDGREIPIDDSGAPIRFSDGVVHGVVLVFRDFTERKRHEALLRTRLRLSDMAQQAGLEELIQTALDEAEVLTKSCIGYFHIVDEDQQNLTLQSWSTNTLKNMCQADGKGKHYPISQAGVWVDCLRTLAPVIHNDYAGLVHKKGLPEGHAPVIRDLGVPVLRGDRVVAIIGVGNKATDYTESDILVLQSLAVPLMDLVRYKIAEQSLRESEERRIVAEAVHSERQRFNEVLNRLPAYVVLLSPDYHVPFANRFFEERFGRSNGHRCYEYLFNRTAPCENCETFKVFKTNAPHRWKWTGPDSRDYDIHDFPFTDADGASLIMEVGIDITERNRAERALKEANETLEQRVIERTSALAAAKLGAEQAKSAAEEANKTKGQFLANISHELRTPMNAILGMIDLALQNQVDTNAKDFLQTAKESADLLLALLNDLLDCAKIESGKLELESAPFSLHRVLNQTTQVLAVRASEKGILFSCRIQPEVPDGLIGDQVRLRQILLNLAGNGVKFTNHGEVTVTVYADSQDEGAAHLRFEVQDTGIGIQHKELERIFQPFAQADPSTTRQYGGTGLGLAISASLVGMMGGQIWAESKPGKGSTFCFTVCLPLAKDLPSEPEAADTLAKATTSLRILLVEDNPANQKLAAYILRARGHTVDIAGDGQRGLDMAQDDSYDVILMDVQMPSMDGLEATKAIRTREKGKRRVPIIAMTAHAMKGDRERCLAFGMDGYLSKPIDGYEMIALAEGLAARSASARSESDPALQSPSEDANTPAEVFDPELAMKRCLNSPTMLSDMVECFFNDIDCLFPQMHLALRKGDFAKVGSLGHRLKGTIIYLGAELAGEAALQVERFERIYGEQSEVEESVHTLERECEALKKALVVYNIKNGPRSND
jgi:two-component system, sensor histidine kinase and response regulator